MSLTSDEINFLIYRYLRESGFDHSAYAFGHESFVHRSALDGSGVPPGALISFVQKGLQYVEIESHLTDDGNEIICDESFSVLKKHECRMKQKRALHAPYDPFDHDYGPLEIDTAIRIIATKVQLLDDNDRLEQLKAMMSTAMAWAKDLPIVALGCADGKVRVWEIKEVESSHSDKSSSEFSAPRRPRQYSLLQVLDRTGRAVATEEEERKAREMKRKGQKRQKLHQNDMVARSAQATETNDATALSNHSILTLDWHPRARSLAGGCYDGSAYIWNSKGEIQHSLLHHTAPITVLKWNRTGDRLLSCSVDHSVCVWDTNTGKIIQQYLVHNGPIIDADWSPSHDSIFVTGGTDGQIFIYNQESSVKDEATANGTGANAGIGREPRSLIGHTGDVNTIRFDPSGQYFASGGDDRIARVWSTSTNDCVQSFSDASGSITLVKFTLSEPIHLTPHTSPPLILAVASSDTTCRLYDCTANGKLLHVLSRHSHPVTSMTFQPGNAILATASHDRVHLWHVNDGSLVKTFRSEGEGGVNEIQFDGTGRRLGVTYADGINYVIPLEQILKA